jgi:hypothetical protein
VSKAFAFIKLIEIFVFAIELQRSSQIGAQVRVASTLGKVGSRKYSTP